MPEPDRLWWAPYIGIPFVDKGRTWDGCDCYGLARLVLGEQLGIWMPSYTEHYESAEVGAGVSAAWTTFEPLWTRIEEPRPFAVVLFSFPYGCLHCGVMVDDRQMLHVERGKAAVKEAVDAFRKKPDGFYWPK
jgi:cell wall-associated NlpC family hydrolase